MSFSEVISGFQMTCCLIFPLFFFAALLNYSIIHSWGGFTRDLYWSSYLRTSPTTTTTTTHHCRHQHCRHMCTFCMKSLACYSRNPRHSLTARHFASQGCLHCQKGPWDSCWASSQGGGELCAGGHGCHLPNEQSAPNRKWLISVQGWLWSNQPTVIHDFFPYFQLLPGLQHMCFPCRHITTNHISAHSALRHERWLTVFDRFILCAR